MGLYESVASADLARAMLQHPDRSINELRRMINPYARSVPSQPSPYGMHEIVDTTPSELATPEPRLTKAQQFRDKFGNLNERIFVISSNVVMMEYYPSKNALTVEFKRWIKGVGRVTGGGAQYFYLNITREEWMSAKQAGSKGKWVWAVLRRGGKPYYRTR